MPRPWRTLVLIYRWTDVRRPRVRRAMRPSEYEANLRALEAVPAAVASWSEGNARMDPFDVIEAPQPLRSLSPAGNGTWWAAPADCQAELNAYAAGGRYDSVIVLWPSDGVVPLCGWGCSIGPSPQAYGAGFSSCVSDWGEQFASRLHPEEGFVHEWLHQVEATFRALGVPPDVFPDLHAAGELRSARPPAEPPHGETYGAYEARTGTWQPWYRDWMTGWVRRPGGDGRFGLGPEVWALRR